MSIAAIALTIALLLETVPSAAAGIARFGQGIRRLDSLTRLGLTEGRNRWVVPTLGALHLVGSAAVIVGLAMPGVGVAGAALEGALFLWVLSRQVRAGDRGSALGAYGLFSATALAVLVVDAPSLVSWSEGWLPGVAFLQPERA